MNIAVIGGGAAGFFAAINCAIKYPEHSVTIYEKSKKVLAKVRVSGGGRCNVTNANFDISRLNEFYPRGYKELINAFSRFGATDSIQWFESRGVKLKTEKDGRMFPVSDNSQTIIDCLQNEATINHVRIKYGFGLDNIFVNDNGNFEMHFQNEEKIIAERVIITSGGSININNYEWIEKLNHSIIPPVPSLFTFNIPDSPLKGLEGISSQSAGVSLEGFKFISTGPLLITHWGISGPAVLRLSAIAARWLNERNYSAKCFVNWFSTTGIEELKDEILSLKKNSPSRKINSISFNDLSSRLWERICKLSGINENEKLGDLSKEKINYLIMNCCRMSLQISGKTTFKEEFVTSGGVNLKDVNMQSMESKKVKGIYFAGEILDIDGITGGFNFQAAWTTGFLAGINAGG